MQILENPFPFGLGFLRQPQPGIRQQAGDELQVKAGAVDTARPAKPTAATLAEAVRALRADGRLPPRGSLLDLRA